MCAELQISSDHSSLYSLVCSVPVQSCRAPHHSFPFIIIQQERHSLHPFTSVHTAHDVHCNCQDWVVLDWLYFVYLSMWSERSITACTGNMVDICTYIFLHNSISADFYSKKHADDSDQGWRHWHHHCHHWHHVSHLIIGSGSGSYLDHLCNVGIYGCMVFIGSIIFRFFIYGDGAWIDKTTNQYAICLHVWDTLKIFRKSSFAASKDK